MSTAAPRHPAEERVHRFMLEYDAQWRRAEPLFNDRDRKRTSPTGAFQVWRELMEQTARNHFADPSSVGLAQSFGSRPEYGPQAETFEGSEVHGDVAYVRTTGGLPLSRTHEYVLHAQDGDWKIVAIDDHYGDPTQPFTTPDEVDEQLRRCSPDAPLAAMPPAQAGLDEVRNFTEREVSGLEEDGTSAVVVSPIGTLVTNSGVLTTIDFGYDNDDARPLARTVAPGSYPVDRVTAVGRNAAVRVRFTEETPATWHPASLPESGHVIGVDAGCVCIMDYVSYTAMTRRDKAAAMRRFGAAERPAAVEVPLDGANVGIAVDSGYGDGGYPAYWGVDAQGGVAQLVVDFLVLAEEDEEAAGADGAVRLRTR